MKVLNVLKAFITTLFLVFVLVVGMIVYISGKGDFYGWRMLVVKSGSMEPKIKTGSLIFVSKQPEYHQDDVVTFGSPTQAETLITHRIVEIEQSNDKKLIKTKGDFNQIEDKDKSNYSSIVGKYEWGIPYLGYVIDFAKTPAGVVLLVVVPGTIIIYDELLNIKKTIATAWQKKKQKEPEHQEASVDT